VKVRLLGAKGHGGRVNRDGIGAVVKFTPQGGKTAMLPVVSGSSFLSQNSLILGYGLGHATKGVLEVLWPGGVRNKLYDVPRGIAGSRPRVMPEIPVSFDDPTISLAAYEVRVAAHLAGLVRDRLISPAEATWFQASATRAYLEAHAP
jgi:hypothetical protein